MVKVFGWILAVWGIGILIYGIKQWVEGEVSSGLLSGSYALGQFTALLFGVILIITGRAMVRNA